MQKEWPHVELQLVEVEVSRTFGHTDRILFPGR